MYSDRSGRRSNNYTYNNVVYIERVQCRTLIEYTGTVHLLAYELICLSNAIKVLYKAM